jgi:hypothetical protein
LKKASMNGASSENSLSATEMMGILSARLAHTLSNQVSIISGNLCAAAMLKNEPAKVASVLQAAVQASNQAGVALGQFVQFRRKAVSEAGRTRVSEFIEKLKRWTKAEPDWRVDIDAKLELLDYADLPISWARFSLVLATIKDQAKPVGGVVRFSQSTARPALTPVWDSLQPIAFTQIVIQTRAGAGIDWEAVRRDFSNPQLAVAYEIIAQSGPPPEGRWPEQGLQETKMVLPIVNSVDPR